MKNDIFAERLQIAMYWNELTGADLSRRSGVPASTICRYICGQRLPNVEKLIKLSKALNVSADYLIGLTDEMKRIA